MLFATISPYWGKNFFAFFGEFANRIGLFLSGMLSFKDLASDEIQIMVLSLLAVSCGLLGAFLQLKRMTMLANSLSHTILLGIVIAFLLAKGTGDGFAHQPIDLTTLLIGSFLTAIITTFLTQFLTRTLKLQEDASIGLVFTGLFALGIVFVTLFTRDVHIGTEAVMGNVDVLSAGDLKMALGLAVFNIVIFGLLFKEFQILSFDGNLAKSLGISGVFFHYLLMLQLAATTIGAFRAVGVLLVLAFLVGPYLTSRLVCNRLKGILFLAPAAGIFCSLLGVALSRHFLSNYGLALSTGGMVVVIIFLLYLAVLCITFLRKALWQKKVLVH